MKRAILKALTNSQAGQSGNTLRFSQISLCDIFANCLLGQRPQSPLNGICDTGYAFILNADDFN